MDDLVPVLFVLFVALTTFALLLSVRPAPEILVVVVAGHGGHDPGAVVNNVQEKDINLTLALLVQKKARDAGLKVVLTRTTDVYVDLVERVRMAETLGASLYVSIHANYHRDVKVCGVETWVDTKAHAESVRLAESLQRAVVITSGAVDRGVHRQTLYLRHTSLPAALIEVGYISCPAEREKLLDPVHQERIAAGIVQGILSYLGR
ncbi:MAG: N-acetylmuramoyl-L-alanine amidase [Candidatus Bipolaricaulota bacterium]|nr:N-acetylmuramoyl-L-alanine amidase [Candidatus Bipolaricaulota bacterium]MDW8127216.1 N-acetylmuramoyl-L-alanine amidase [Candidatus Bipolaricaulota bacterium]